MQDEFDAPVTDTDETTDATTEYEDLGDVRDLTRNGRAQITENNRGHG